MQCNLMQDDLVALFTYDRWANRKVLDVLFRGQLAAGRLPTEAELATVDDAAQLLERAYRHFEELRQRVGRAKG